MERSGSFQLRNDGDEVLLRDASGATIALRAEMDAVSVHEMADVPFKSLNPGVMHATGHDLHAAIVLGAAYVLSTLKDRFAGNVKFLFQPASEAPPADEEKPAGEKPADGGDGAAAEELKKAEEAEAKAQVALEERRRVESENRRKQDQYDDQVKAAQKRVRELNNRFADWYYIVPEAEFGKIHLDRAAVVQEKEAAAEAKQ